jgi:hypothetical protein
MRAWVEARQLQVIAAMGEQAADPLGKDWIREDVAAALRLSRNTAIERLEFARSLKRLPATMESLQRGEITAMHARVLAESVAPLDDAQAAAVEREALPLGKTQTVGAFRRTAARAVLAASSDGAEQRHALARAERRVAFTPVADGMEVLWALLPAERCAEIRARLDAELSRIGSTDPRTADQQRADVLCDLAGLAGLPDGELPTSHGARPAVQVTVALSTLLGLDEQPAELAGHGPIPAALARRIAADPSGTWSRLVTDAHGRLLDVGRSTYRPPADLARFVIARDRTCCFPGCTRAAARCDLDHRVAWDDGGRTDAGNLYALCPRHHQLKHETGWRYRPAADGEVEWTAPTGHRRRRAAATYPVDRTTDAVGHDPPPF